MRIISIDPGYERLGIAVLEKNEKSKEILLYSSCFFTSKDLSHPERLALVGKEIARVIAEYSPTALAVETLFFSKNTKTALFVAEARGVILYEAASHNLKIYEYSPIAIKVAVTGYGKSDKAQVITMIDKLVKITKKIKYDDEYDAIAAGLTFFATYRSLSTGKS
jgi:crossover junction endodeoxyribonuclease RuvC